MLITKFLALLPAHKCELIITHNGHRNSYVSVAEYVARNDGPENFVSQEDYELAIKGDELWEIQWYPETPIGSYIVYGTTLENALAATKGVK